MHHKSFVPSCSQSSSALSHLFKAIITGTKKPHRQHLSWFLAKRDTSSREPTNQFLNMYNLQRTTITWVFSRLQGKKHSADALVQISAWATQQKWGSYGSTLRLTLWDPPLTTKKSKTTLTTHTHLLLAALKKAFKKAANTNQIQQMSAHQNNTCTGFQTN